MNNVTALRTFLTRKTTNSASRELGRSYWDILRANLFSFFNIILFAVDVISVIFGRYNDAFITVSAGLAGTVVNAFQEIRAKRQLAQIMLLTHPTAQVIRDGIEQTVDATELKKGDAVHLRGGDQALADGVVISVHGQRAGAAEIDESLLTGESDPVRKQSGDKILSGSFCLSGDLVYRAEAVGAESFAQQLATQARTFAPTSTPLQQQISFVIRLLMALTVVMALLFYIGGWLSGSTLLQYVTGSAVLVGLVPYGLFLTISLAYTIGAVTLARQGAIVQRTQAIEALQHVDVLCMDKTGTLTANALHLQTVQPLGQIRESEVKQFLGDFAYSAGTTNATTAAIRQGLAGRQRQLVDEVAFCLRRIVILGKAVTNAKRKVPSCEFSPLSSAQDCLKRVLNHADRGASQD